VSGGSEIAVSPSTSFFLDKEYIIFFDEIDENYRIVGYDYTYTLLNSVDLDDIEIIRKIPKIEDLMVGGVTAVNETEDVAEADIVKKPKYPNKDQARTLVLFTLLSIAGIISVLLLKRVRKI
jgi:hypothetical protein